MIPGELFIQDGEIELNAGRKTVTLSVANSGDRPIQVGSHYHFFETNPALKFDRRRARGMRLDIAAGTAVRFEPGQTRDVQLVALAGKRVVYGFRGDVMGKAMSLTSIISPRSLTCLQPRPMGRTPNLWPPAGCTTPLRTPQRRKRNWSEFLGNASQRSLSK